MIELMAFLTAVDKIFRIQAQTSAQLLLMYQTSTIAICFDLNVAIVFRVKYVDSNESLFIRIMDFL
jgi:hypothetical protein